MVTKEIQDNSRDITAELVWFKSLLTMRGELNAKNETDISSIYLSVPPDLSESKSRYALFVKEHQLGFEERCLLMLTLIPHVKPQLLDVFFVKNGNTQALYTEFGGKKGRQHLGFLPTGETLMFLLAGYDLALRFSLMRLFDATHFLIRDGIIKLETADASEPVLSGALVLSEETFDLFTLGKISRPKYSSEFPAQLLETPMEWDDLVLNPQTKGHLEEIQVWLDHKDKLMNEWEMHKTLKPGYRALFYGSPGTGKTLAATLLAKRIGVDVYRVDLSKIVSKYIGETEKNLARVFDRAEDKEWILFFDEADALFGKRTNVNDAHDRYANQEVSYLLQRIEGYNGLVVLATNLKSNIDDAFIRRFQSIVEFPVPDVNERLQLWKRSFSPKVSFQENVRLEDVAKSYSLSGGSIINVVQYSSLMALKRGCNIVKGSDIKEGVKREYSKSNRTL